MYNCIHKTSALYLNKISFFNSKTLYKHTTAGCNVNEHLTSTDQAFLRPCVPEGVPLVTGVGDVGGVH